MKTLSDVMSPEEIEKMLSGAGEIDSNNNEENAADIDSAEQSQVESDESLDGSTDISDYLSRDEQDVLGEIGNISMGTAATTMSTLLDHKVLITTPQLSIHTLDTLSEEYPAPLVVSEVSYTRGLFGDNLLILKEYDVALITNLLLGETAEVDPDNVELTDIHLSAMNEVMNQMVGSSATSMADIFGKTIDISTPSTKRLKIRKDKISDVFSKRNEPFVKISFRMEIEGLLTSELMQIIPIDMSMQMAKEVLGEEQMRSAEIQADVRHEEVQLPDEPAVAAQQPAVSAMEAPQQVAPAAQTAQQPLQDTGMQQQMPQQNVQQPVQQQPQMQQNVQQPSFPSFSSGQQASISSIENIDLILDVPMNVTVELGKTRQKIRNILEYNMGSVIVLDKIAGEAVDILVNGKRIGRGEVVVIDDSYGVRITEINDFSAEELL